MKSLTIFAIGILLHFSVHGQLDHELNAWYKFGLSTNSFRSTLNHTDPGIGTDLEWRRAHMLHDHSFNLEYKAEVWKKAKLYVLGGLEIGKSSYYIPIVNNNKYEIGEINFHNNKAGYFFGVAKRFELYNSKVKLDIGYRIKDLYPFQRNVNFSQDWMFSETRDWIEYKYSLDVQYRQLVSKDNSGSRYGIRALARGEPFVNIQFNLSDQWFLNLQASYQRNNYFFYNYTYNIRYYLGGSSTPNGFEDFLGTSGVYFRNDDLIYTSLGISYNFSKKKNTIKTE